MKLYTIKDFLKYATPCYWCGNKCAINLENWGVNNNSNYSTTYLVTNSFKLEEFDNYFLIFSSPKGIFRFNIISNEFKTNNESLINENNYNITINCQCGLRYSSKNLVFNTSNNINYIEPFEITTIYKFMYNKLHFTQVFEDDGSIVVSMLAPNLKKYTISNKSLKDFKNKEALLERIKIYLLFS